MSHFALLWKARTIEKYRQNYESEKIKSILVANAKVPQQSLSQRWRHYRYDTQRRISGTFRRWYPEGSMLSNLLVYLKTDQTFPNFVLKSVLGFVGGIVLTYLCFMFFVFQLSISLMHATLMSSVIGVLLTLGLAFSYRIRCLVFLLIPQLFSRVGRYSLTCYALVLILTGPATNTLKNSEVLSESLACGQEQIKSNVNQINCLRMKPLNSMKDSMKLMIDRLKEIAVKMKQLTVKMNRLVLSIAQVIRSGYLWLNSLSSVCNKKLGLPHQRCASFLKNAMHSTAGNYDTLVLLNSRKHKEICSKLKPEVICVLMEHLNEDIVPVIKKRLKNFSERITHMMSLQLHVHHSYSFSSNTSRSASQVAAGIVTEIRRRADPLLTWLSWSSCVTSLFLLLIIFRGKYYQHMFETRSRYDNRYITKEIRDLDLKRLREGRETILPLNRRERAKYVTTTSFRLVASEKIYLNRSVVFMSITTFKLLVHMVADYSLYWVLMTIRYHGRFQSVFSPGPANAGLQISGTGPTADLLKSILASLSILLDFPMNAPVSCLPNPYPPDFRRYTQIGVLIFLLWVFAMFEPYGLRLRHVIMGHYQPERAKARAVWLYNHILRTRGGFMKFARRKLHRTFKYRSEEKNTFRRRLNSFIPFSCLRYLLGTCPEEPHCLLCLTRYYAPKPDTRLIRCKTSGCPGVYCASCFSDIGELCTICLSPKDYGDMSDVSLEKGSSDESDDDNNDSEKRFIDELRGVSGFSVCENKERDIFSRRAHGEFTSYKCANKRQDRMPLLPRANRHSPNTKTDIYDVTKRHYKKASLIRHKKYINSNQTNIIKREYVISFCEYCNKEECKKQHKLKSLNKKLLLLSNKNESSDTSSGYSISQNTVNAISKVVTNLVKTASLKYGDINNCGGSKTIKRFMKVNDTVPPAKLTRNLRDKSKLSVKNFKRPLKMNMAKRNAFRLINNHKEPNKKVVVNSCTLRDNKTDKRGKSKTSKRKNHSKKKKIKEHTPTKTSNNSRKLHVLFFNYWRYFKTTTLWSRIYNSIKKANPSVIGTKNHKRRKKKTNSTILKSDIEKSVELPSNTTQKYRISAFLAEQDWIKRQCKEFKTKKNANLDSGGKVKIKLSVLESPSNNLKKKLSKRELKKVTELKPETPGKVVKELPAGRILDAKEKKIMKMTCDELWSKLGYGLSNTSSSSSSNIFLRKSNTIFGRDENVRPLSSDESRRIKFYEPKPTQGPKRQGISLKKYQPTDYSDRIHVFSSTDQGVADNESHFTDKQVSNNSDCAFWERLMRIKRCLFDPVRYSCDSSTCLVKKHVCKNKKPEFPEINKLEEVIDTMGEKEQDEEKLLTRQAGGIPLPLENKVSKSTSMIAENKVSKTTSTIAENKISKTTSISIDASKAAMEENTKKSTVGLNTSFRELSKTKSTLTLKRPPEDDLKTGEPSKRSVACDCSPPKIFSNIESKRLTRKNAKEDLKQSIAALKTALRDLTKIESTLTTKVAPTDDLKPEVTTKTSVACECFPPLLVYNEERIVTTCETAQGMDGKTTADKCTVVYPAQGMDGKTTADKCTVVYPAHGMDGKTTADKSTVVYPAQGMDGKTTADKSTVVYPAKGMDGKTTADKSTVVYPAQGMDGKTTADKCTVVYPAQGMDGKTTADKSTVVYPAQGMEGKTTADKSTVVYPVTKVPKKKKSDTVCLWKRTVDHISKTSKRLRSVVSKKDSTVSKKESIVGSKKESAVSKKESAVSKKEPAVSKTAASAIKGTEVMLQAYLPLSKSVQARDTVYEDIQTRHSSIQTQSTSPKLFKKESPVSKAAPPFSKGTETILEAFPELRKPVQEKDTVYDDTRNSSIQTEISNHQLEEPTISKRKLSVTEGTETVAQAPVQLSKSVQVKKTVYEDTKTPRSTDASTQNLRLKPPESKKIIEEKSPPKSLEEDNPCDGVCNVAGGKSAVKTCTCATQYLYIDDDSSSEMKRLREFLANDDKNLEKEIYEYTSSSCSGSDTLLSSSISTDPDDPETCTNATLCNVAQVNETPRSRKRKKVKVVTISNQCTCTERPTLCDASTQDWWSPIVENKKSHEDITVKNIDKGFKFKRTVTEFDREIRFDVNIKETEREMPLGGQNYMSLERKGCFLNTIGDQQAKKIKASNIHERTVTFKSRAELIPLGAQDILSPSRYLLESQRYYNELFTPKFYAPHLFPVNMPRKSVNGSTNSSSTYRNYKAKRLDKCSSPHKQIISPRRRSVGYEWFRVDELVGDKCQTRNIYRSPMKGNRLRLKCEKFALKLNKTKLNVGVASNGDISMHVRCNSTSSF